MSTENHFANSPLDSAACVSRLRSVASENAADDENDASHEAWLANLATVAADLIESTRAELTKVLNAAGDLQLNAATREGSR